MKNKVNTNILIVLPIKAIKPTVKQSCLPENYIFI